MIYDIHTHLMAEKCQKDKEDLLRAADVYGISKLFVSGLNSLPNPTEEMADEMNREVWTFHREHPELVEGYVYLSPEHPGAVTMFRRAVEDWGFIGLKLWMASFCDAPQVFPLIETAIDYRVPVLIHAFHKAVQQLPFESTAEHVANLAQRYPQAELIMAHLGGNEYHGLPAIRDFPNVWVDMCSSMYGNDTMAYAVEQVGADRILYGTDMPGSYLVNIGQIQELDISAADREKILFRNAHKLFYGEEAGNR